MKKMIHILTAVAALGCESGSAIHEDAGDPDASDKILCESNLQYTQEGRQCNFPIFRTEGGVISGEGTPFHFREGSMADFPIQPGHYALLHKNGQHFIVRYAGVEWNQPRVAVFNDACIGRYLGVTLDDFSGTLTPANGYGFGMRTDHDGNARLDLNCDGNIDGHEAMMGGMSIDDMLKCDK